MAAAMRPKMDGRERRALLDRWAKLSDRARAAPADSEARQWSEEWTREWRKRGYPLPPAGDEVLRERAELLEALLD